MSDKAVGIRKAINRRKTSRFFKKSVSFPAEILPHVKARLKEPRYHGNFSLLMTDLVLADQEAFERAEPAAA